MALIKHREKTPDSLGDWPLGWLPSWRWFDDMFHDSAGRQVIRVEEFQKDGALVIRAEMPGIDPEKDVEVTVEGGMLHIAAERREEEDTTERSSHRRELHYGSFARSIALPEGVDDSGVTASYNNGILEVEVPLPTEVAKEPSRRIPVATS